MQAPRLIQRALRDRVQFARANLNERLADFGQFDVTRGTSTNPTLLCGACEQAVNASSVVAARAAIRR